MLQNDILSALAIIFIAIFLLDTAGDDGVASMLWWGQDTDGALDSLDAAMLKTEFMLVGCKKGVDGCDFSSSEV